MRHCLEILGPRQGIEITSHADIPSRGSGLGSSSSFTVGLLNGSMPTRGGMHHRKDWRNRRVSGDQLCGDSIGKRISSRRPLATCACTTSILMVQSRSKPLRCRTKTLRFAEQSADVLHRHHAQRGRYSRSKRRYLASSVPQSKRCIALCEHAHDVRHELESGNADGVGELLHESWLLKRSLTNGISNAAIDGWYEAARKAGALGGKILGAGGGGFLLLYVPRERQAAVKQSLSQLRQSSFRFEREGSKIIFYNPTTLDPERGDEAFQSQSGL